MWKEGRQAGDPRTRGKDNGLASLTSPMNKTREGGQETAFSGHRQHLWGLGGSLASTYAHRPKLSHFPPEVTRPRKFMSHTTGGINRNQQETSDTK